MELNYATAFYDNKESLNKIMFKKHKLEKELFERQSENVRLKKELKDLRSALLEIKVLNEIIFINVKT